MSDPVPARFLFKGKDLEVEFEGRADFVTAQIQHFKDAFAAASAADAPRPAAAAAGTAAGAPEAPAAASSPAGTTAAPAPGAPSAQAATKSGEVSLEQFYKNAKSRVGRGALQETILIFAYFLREHRSKEEFGIENLNACFSLVGVQPPKSLANTLGIMKRNLKFFHSGSRRGTYALTEKGNAYVKRLAGST